MFAVIYAIKYLKELRCKFLDAMELLFDIALALVFRQKSWLLWDTHAIVEIKLCGTAGNKCRTAGAATLFCNRCTGAHVARAAYAGCPDDFPRVADGRM